MTDLITIDDLYELVFEFFGRHLQFPYFRSTESTVGGVLYETFELEWRLDERSGSFGAAIRIGPRLSTTEFFGNSLPSTPAREVILENLQVIDEWSRAHLPIDFLTRYDAA